MPEINFVILLICHKADSRTTVFIKSQLISLKRREACARRTKSYLKWCSSLGVSVSINSTKSLKTASISMSAREVCEQERLFHPSKYRGEILRDEQAIMVTALSADRFSFLFFKISKVLQKRGAVP